jgi:hypothetical protein
MSMACAPLLPNAQYRTLDGQAHVLKPKAHAPTLVGFFNDQLERDTTARNVA